VETSEMAEAFYFMIFVTGGKSPNIWKNKNDDDDDDDDDVNNNNDIVYHSWKTWTNITDS
jgi:hypothetical protein